MPLGISTALPVHCGWQVRRRGQIGRQHKVPPTRQLWEARLVDGFESAPLLENFLRRQMQP